MDRRKFFLSAARATLPMLPPQSRGATSSETVRTDVAGDSNSRSAGKGRDLRFHRVGVDDTPSRNGWFCWNDWAIDLIKREPHALAALRVDHRRAFPIWPFFQPDATWVRATLCGTTDRFVLAERISGKGTL